MAGLLGFWRAPHAVQRRYRPTTYPRFISSTVETAVAAGWVSAISYRNEIRVQKSAHLCWDQEPGGSHDRRKEDEGVEGRDHGLGASLPGAGEEPLQRRRGEEQEAQP